jgi:hypothetical protein
MPSVKQGFMRSTQHKVELWNRLSTQPLQRSCGACDSRLETSREHQQLHEHPRSASSCLPLVTRSLGVSCYTQVSKKLSLQGRLRRELTEVEGRTSLNARISLNGGWTNILHSELICLKRKDIKEPYVEVTCRSTSRFIKKQSDKQKTL